MRSLIFLLCCIVQISLSFPAGADYPPAESVEPAVIRQLGAILQQHATIKLKLKSLQNQLIFSLASVKASDFDLQRELQGLPAVGALDASTFSSHQQEKVDFLALQDFALQFQILHENIKLEILKNPRMPVLEIQKALQLKNLRCLNVPGRYKESVDRLLKQQDELKLAVEIGGPNLRSDHSNLCISKFSTIKSKYQLAPYLFLLGDPSLGAQAAHAKNQLRPSSELLIGSLLYENTLRSLYMIKALSPHFNFDIESFNSIELKQLLDKFPHLESLPDLLAYEQSEFDEKIWFDNLNNEFISNPMWWSLLQKTQDSLLTSDLALEFARLILGTDITLSEESIDQLRQELSKKALTQRQSMWDLALQQNHEIFKANRSDRKKMYYASASAIYDTISASIILSLNDFDETSPQVLKRAVEIVEQRRDTIINKITQEHLQYEQQLQSFLYPQQAQDDHSEEEGMAIHTGPQWFSMRLNWLIRNLTKSKQELFNITNLNTLELKNKINTTDDIPFDFQLLLKAKIGSGSEQVYSSASPLIEKVWFQLQASESYEKARTSFRDYYSAFVHGLKESREPRHALEKLTANERQSREDLEFRLLYDLGSRLHFLDEVKDSEESMGWKRFELTDEECERLRKEFQLRLLEKEPLLRWGQFSADASKTEQEVLRALSTFFQYSQSFLRKFEKYKSLETLAPLYVQSQLSTQMRLLYPMWSQRVEKDLKQSLSLNSKERLDEYVNSEYINKSVLVLLGFSGFRWLSPWIAPRAAPYLEVINQYLQPYRTPFDLSIFAWITLRVRDEVRAFFKTRGDHILLDDLAKTSPRIGNDWITAHNQDSSKENWERTKQNFFITQGFNLALLVGLPLSVYGTQWFASRWMISEWKIWNTSEYYQNLFSRLGFAPDHFTWNMEIIDQVQRRYRNFIDLVQIKRNSRNHLEPSSFSFENRKNDMLRVRKILNRIVKKYEAKFARLALWHRFDFERLQLKPGNWELSQIENAMNKFENLHQEKAISDLEWMEIRKSGLKILQVRRNWLSSNGSHPLASRQQDDRFRDAHNRIMAALLQDIMQGQVRGFKSGRSQDFLDEYSGSHNAENAYGSSFRLQDNFPYKVERLKDERTGEVYEIHELKFRRRLGLEGRQ